MVLLQRKTPSKLLSLYTFAIILCWTLLSVGMALWNIHGHRQHQLESARLHAQAVLNSDLVYQRRFADQGGFYVPLTEETLPNPWLTHLENREVTTTSGTKLTLITPSYMSNEIHQLAFEQFGYQGHMTSLQPLRPENQPDAWEKSALEAFARGVKEVTEIINVNGNSQLHLMRPMYRQDHCLKCHPQTTEDASDILGGISLAVPLQPLWTDLRQHLGNILLTYGLIWLAGLLGIGVSNRHLQRYLLEREKTEHALQESEQRFEMLFDQAPLSYQSLDDEGKFIKVNTAWTETFGYQPEEIVNRDFSSLMSEKSKLVFANTFPQFKQRGQTHNVELGVFRQDGELRLVSVNGKIGYDNQGNFKQTHCILTDITARRKTEAIVETQRIWLDTIINTLPDMICLKDGAGRWLLANTFELQLFDLQGVDYQGKTSTELAAESPFFCESLLFCNKTDKMAWQARMPSRTIHRVPQHDGSEKVFDILKVPLFNDRGDRNFLIVAGRDVTATKAAEHALQLSEKSLNRAQEVAQIGSWHLDLKTNILTCSKQTYRIFNIPSDSSHAYQLILDCMHPDDQEMAAAAWKAALKGDPYEIEHRILVDGQVKWVHEKAELEFDLSRQAVSCTGVCWDITPYKMATQQVKTAKEQWQRTFDSVDDIILIMEPDLRVRKLNKAAISLLGNGKPEKELIGKTCHELFSNQNTPCLTCPAVQAINEQGHHYNEIVHQSLDRSFLVSAAPIYDDHGTITAIAHFAKDITEQKKLSAQLLQSQKMEGIGRLAGGVAHDFNNILTVINGHAELALLSTPVGNRVNNALKEILQAGDRASALTRQLLAFSRKQIIRPKIVEINTLVANLGKMLRRLIGEDIELHHRLTDNLPPVLADPGQLEQIIINLVVNAADAIHAGPHNQTGVITISTTTATFDQEYLRNHEGSSIGTFVQLEIADNGLGIPADIRDKIFEPFFTTKEHDKGTGLGLATVYGIVKQNLGSIYVTSEPGKETTFQVNWPAAREQGNQPADVPAQIDITTGKGTILLVEDEEKLLQLTKDSLTMAGYHVLAAINGQEAITIAERYDDHLDLLFTDIVMPGINGLEAAKQIVALRPTIKVLYTSGYTGDRLELQEVNKDLLLDKPYSLPVLTARIQEILLPATQKES
ncbi:MAG: PAS domain S-box protein [Deltaproteobacteria bacterium]|nr:PAS domain S-box protein [Candidatus Anaeroferrophillus wilburensis]MBN2888504.1 PAS domain S-box protein [Deltaproteobacteria bacterium]